MKLATTFFSKIKITDKFIPGLLLITCILGYGLLIFKLGYFQDDWNYVFNHFRYGSNGIINFMQHDGRPIGAWIYLTAFPILGYKPVLWHITSLIMRWLTALVLWLIFRSLWPEAKLKNFIATLIFILYPFFTIQPLAVAYLLHWTGYLFYMLSIYFMLKALNKKAWLFTILALITQAIHLFSLEYFAGIDLLRPVLLWISLTALKTDSKQRLKSTFIHWLPYLAILTTFFIWRGFFYQAATEGRNDPLGVRALLESPVSAATDITLNAIQDSTLLLISSWSEIIKPEYVDLRVSANRYIGLISLISFGFYYFALSRYSPSQEDEKNYSAQMLFLGILSLFLGLLPAFAAGFVVHTKIPPWNSRFSLGSLFGAALIITVILEYAITVPRKKWLVTAVLLGLLTGWHLHYTNDFRWAWDKQLDFYTQLTLRAPYIEPGTIILSDEEFLGFMGDYPTALSINTIYTQPTRTSSYEVDYWFLPLSEFYNRFDAYLANEEIEIYRANTTFHGNSHQAIVITFHPEHNQCLWILAPTDRHFKQLPQVIRELTTISSPDLIQNDKSRRGEFIASYLASNPPQDWCSLYTQADLASQFKQWDQVVAVWEFALQADERPENGYEYLPFIKAYAHSDDWDTAIGLTKSAYKLSKGMDSILCVTWQQLENSTSVSPQKDEALATFREIVACQEG